MHYTERLKDLRKEAGLTQKEIAGYLGCSQQLYSNYEQGCRRLPVKHLILLAEYYNVSADYILGIDQKSEPAIKI